MGARITANTSSLEKYSKIAIISLLIPVLVGVIWTLFRGDSSNLKLKSAGEYIGPEDVAIPLLKSMDFAAMTPGEILENRASATKDFSNLLKKEEYSPRKEIFEQILPNTPWITSKKLYYYGREPGKDNVVAYNGSAASKTLLNPFLFVKAEFWGLSIWRAQNLKWDRERFPLATLAAQRAALTPKESNLIIHPSSQSAEVTYNLTQYLMDVNQYLKTPLTASQASFGLYFQNARDFGLDVAWLDTQESRNLHNPNEPKGPVKLIDIYSAVGVAWSGKIYNHLSPHTPAFNSIEITELPARAVFRLWHTYPDSDEVPPDLTFIIHFI